MAAALAFYAIFSIAPLLLLILAVAGKIYGPHAARADLFESTKPLLGAASAKALGDLLATAKSDSGTSNVLSLILLFIAASGAFARLSESLDIICLGHPRGRRKFVHGLRDRAIGFIAVVAVVATMLVSIAGSTLLSFQGAPLIVDFGASLAVSTLFFAAIYRWVPASRPLGWRAAFQGAAVASACFALGKTGFSIYIARMGPESSYGAARSFVVALIFVYLVAYALLLGAQAAAILQRAARYNSSSHAVS
jgi:membrane protein